MKIRKMNTSISGILAVSFCWAAASSVHASTLSTLEGRLPATAGGTDYQAYYAPDLDLTLSTSFNGEADWYTQKDWAETLNIGGVSGWRLPTSDEMLAVFADNSIGPVPPFSDAVNGTYWSSTSVPDLSLYAYAVYFGGTVAYINDKTAVQRYGWAVYGGDVAAVPVPAAAWLFASGILGLAAFARRKSA